MTMAYPILGSATGALAAIAAWRHQPALVGAVLGEFEGREWRLAPMSLFEGPVRSLFPILPWIHYVLLGIVCGGLVAAFRPDWTTIVFIAGMTVLMVIDGEHKLILDYLVTCLLVGCLLTATLRGPVLPESSILGFAVLWGGLHACRVAESLVTGGDGTIGPADPMFIGVVGAWMGLGTILVALVFCTGAAAVIVTFVTRRSASAPIPLVPMAYCGAAISTLVPLLS